MCPTQLPFYDEYWLSSSTLLKKSSFWYLVCSFDISYLSSTPQSFLGLSFLFYFVLSIFVTYTEHCSKCSTLPTCSSTSSTKCLPKLVKRLLVGKSTLGEQVYTYIILILTTIKKYTSKEDFLFRSKRKPKD